ncbi:MAG: hypothetical protein QM300_12400 [Pseudomonadota bacterium]|jgi:hypothetical protein|nr:hypothetical protein [Pseudomonadota bacterium]
MRNLIALLSCVLLLPIALSADDYTDAWNMGNNLGNEINSSISSSEGLNNAFSVPMTSNNAAMNPLKGTIYRCSDTNKYFQDPTECDNNCPTPCVQGFSSQLQSPSSSAFLEISVTSIGPGGDIRLIISQDTDFDNSFDRNYTLPDHISGICANGYITCDAGTWTNCTYKLWTANPSDRSISILNSDMFHLGGCYAINSSAHPSGVGPSLFLTNIKNSLETIGGGITAAIHNADPRCVVTQAQTDIDNFRILYWGQESDNVAASTTIQQIGNPSPESYYSDPNQLESHGSALLAGEMADSQSFTYISQNTSNQNLSVYNCSISHDIVIGNQTIVYRCYTRSLSFGCIGRNEGSASVAYNLCGTGLLNEPCIDEEPSDGYAAFVECGTGEPPTDATMAGHWKQLNHDNCGDCCGGCHSHCHDFTCDEREYYIWSRNYDLPPGLITTGSCNLPDPECRLFSEDICDSLGYCVNTIRNYISTAKVPQTNCKQVNTDNDNYTACAKGTAITTRSLSTNVTTTVASGNDLWWRINRTYHCPQDKNDFGLDDALARTQSIESSSSVDATGTSLTYTDVLAGAVTTGSVNIHASPGYDSCEMVCKISKARKSSGANVAGHQGQMNRNTDTTVEAYKVCELTGGLWVCPVDNDETLEQDCACLNDFENAISTLSAVKEASKDLICGEQ